MNNSDGNNSRQSTVFLSKELRSFCQSDSLSEDSVRQIFESHGLTPQDHRVSDYKFFLRACRNERVTESIIQCLLEYFPDAASAASKSGWSPLHFSCQNPNVTVNIIQLLIDASPASVRSETSDGRMPLHCLCVNKKKNEATSMEILKLLIEKHPEAVHHAVNNGCLPIHCASMQRSPEFCRVLIEAFPESERMTADNGVLPLHFACMTNTVATVEYLYKLYPDVVNQATTDDGFYPIHHALTSTFHRISPITAVDIVRYLLDCDPNVKFQNFEGTVSLLHWVCKWIYVDANIDAALGIVKAIYDAHPESIRMEDSAGYLPLHLQCRFRSRNADETAVEIMKLLLEKYPEAVRHADNGGSLPIHLALGASKPPEFCRELIEAYPGSEQINDANNVLPLHWACMYNTVATVDYLYRLHPGAIKNSTPDGFYPVHYAIMGMKHRDNPIAAVNIVKFLLDCDPNVKLQKYEGTESLLDVACDIEYNDSNIEVALEIIQVIYDAYPEAIEDDDMVSDIHEYHEQIQSFINTQLVYARLAKDHLLLKTPVMNGQLPLHTALQSNVRLGSIKLLVKGNPPAVQSTNNSGALPLHIACQHHDSSNVVQYLVGLDAATLDAVDRDGNTALHFACHCARHEFIALLLGKYNGVSVSKRNAHGKLPIDLLLESDEVLDRDSVEYTESVFRLLKAYPETVMSIEQKHKKYRVDSVHIHCCTKQMD